MSTERQGSKLLIHSPSRPGIAGRIRLTLNTTAWIIPGSFCGVAGFKMGGDPCDPPPPQQKIYGPGNVDVLNRKAHTFLDGPVTWFRGKSSNPVSQNFLPGVYWIEMKTGLWSSYELLISEKIVTPNQKQYPWYHQKFPRVKTIDECYTDEYDCIYEANEQFKRDRKVDTHILNILRYRIDDCVREEYPDHLPRCAQLKEDYEQAAANWFAKCKRKILFLVSSLYGS